MGPENAVVVMVVMIVAMVAVIVVMVSMIVVMVVTVVMVVVVIMVVIMIVMTAVVAHRNHAQPGLNISLQSDGEPVPPLPGRTTLSQERRFDKSRQGTAV